MYEQIEFGLANGFDGELHGGVGCGGFRAGFVFVLRQAKKKHGGNAEIGDLAALLDNLVGRLLKDAGHGADFGAHFAAGAREHRVDEAGGRKARLAHETAQRFGAA